MLLPVKMILRMLLPVQEKGSVLLTVHPLRTLNRKASGIISGQGGVQRQQDSLPVRAGDYGIQDIRLAEAGIRKDRILRFLFPQIFA